MSWLCAFVCGKAMYQSRNTWQPEKGGGVKKGQRFQYPSMVPSDLTFFHLPCHQGILHLPIALQSGNTWAFGDIQNPNYYTCHVHVLDVSSPRCEMKIQHNFYHTP